MERKKEKRSPNINHAPHLVSLNLKKPVVDRYAFNWLGSWAGDEVEEPGLAGAGE
jgi:hypothetical protein